MRDLTLYEEPIREYSPSDEELELFHGYEEEVDKNPYNTETGHGYDCRCAMCREAEANEYFWGDLLDWGKGLFDDNKNSGIADISRAQWGARPPKCGQGSWEQCGKRKLALPVKLVFIHHTTGQMPMAIEQEYQVMKKLQNYAMDKQHKSDISYNFVVMPSGRIAQGRGGSIVGYATPKNNLRSLSLCFAGDYHNNQPTAESLAACRRFLNKVLKAGYLTPDFNIKGHRNVASTACPGKHLYAQLSSVDPRGSVDQELVLADSHASDQEIAPAVVAAGVAVGTLGYTIVKDLFNSADSGDVTWNLKRMDGTKFPDDDKTTYGHIRGYKQGSFSVKGKLTAGFIDEISASFEVVFSYNKYSVSNIYVQNTGVNDALGWGLVVNQQIQKVDQTFYIGSRPIAAVDVKFHFHFSSALRDDILLINYRIYGNGYWKRTRYRWS